MEINVPKLSSPLDSFVKPKKKKNNPRQIGILKYIYLYLPELYSLAHEITTK